jgi:hypothetical protein
MADEHARDDFDWVAAQSTCNAASMFERLRTRVREDVQRRNGLFDRDDGWKFEFAEEVDQFEVTRIVGSAIMRPRVTALVRFARGGPRIHVQGEDVDVEFTAIVTIDPSGACRFVVGEAMYSDWEIRRMALEQLFFEETEEEE